MLLYFFQINTRVYRVNGTGGIAWRAVACLICTTTVKTVEEMKSPLAQGVHLFSNNDKWDK
jgi:hypothetical protein